MIERMSSKDFRVKYNYDKITREFSDNGKKRNKYRNKTCKWSGIFRGRRVHLVFQSRKERDRAVFLINEEKTGKIKGLEFQKAFLLIPSFKSERCVRYFSDAFYFEFKLDKWVVEDTKSPITRRLAAYIIKRKLLKYQNPDIVFREA